MFCVDQIWTRRGPGELDNGPNSEISFSESGDGDPVRYKSTDVPVDDPPKTRTGESRKQAGVGSAAALCVLCEHKHTKRRRLRRFDSKGVDA